MHVENIWASLDGKSHVNIMWEGNDILTIDVWDCPHNEWNPDSDPPVGKLKFSGRFKLIEEKGGEA